MHPKIKHDSLLYAHSENHWANPSTTKQLLLALQDHVTAVKKKLKLPVQQKWIINIDVSTKSQFFCMELFIS